MTDLIPEVVPDMVQPQITNDSEFDRAAVTGPLVSKALMQQTGGAEQPPAAIMDERIPPPEEQASLDRIATAVVERFTKKPQPPTNPEPPELPKKDQDQTPPNSVEAEEAVLGGLLINPEKLDDVEPILKAEDFFIARHMWIYDALLTLRKRGDAIDNITLMYELRNRNQLEDIGGPAYITYLINSTPTHIHAETYARIVERAAIRRRLLNAAGSIAEMALKENMPIERVCDKAEATLLNAVDRSRQAVTTSNAKSAASRYFDHVEKLYKSGDKLPGISTGFTELDEITAGLQKDELTILAGRPGMGKTAILLALLMNAAKAGQRVGIFSLEMSETSLMQRLMAMETKIDGDKLRRGNLNEREWGLFVEATARIEKLPFFINDNSMADIFYICSHARKMYRETGLDLLLVDYLQIVKSFDKKDRRDLEISEITSGLKSLARELHIPVVAAAQINREVEGRKDKRPMLSDLREGGSQEQDADNVWFLYRDIIYNENTQDPTAGEVIVAKQRQGPIAPAHLRYDGPLMLWSNKLPTTKIHIPDIWPNGEK